MNTAGTSMRISGAASRASLIRKADYVTELILDPARIDPAATVITARNGTLPEPVTVPQEFQAKEPS